MPLLTRSHLADNQRGDMVLVSLSDGQRSGIGVIALGQVPFVSLHGGGNLDLDPDAARTLGTALLAAARVAERAGKA